MNIMALLNALPGSIAQGLIWGVFAIGVYITFKVLDFADMTVDGSIATGGSVAVMMMLSGHNVAVALVAATIVGMLAGMVTGIFHVALGIPGILAGILSQLGLYSVNMRILGKSNQAISVDKYDSQPERYPWCNHCFRDFLYCSHRADVWLLRYRNGSCLPCNGQ